MNFDKSIKLRLKAHSLIPGGAHTYSKGEDQFPKLSPGFIIRGQGAYVWDLDGNKFIDWGMGLTSVLLGHAYEPVIKEVQKEIYNGSNFILPSHIESELAEILVNQIPSAQMVKFGKNGSDATSSAVKLARAYTGKNLILRCADNPFLSIDDWFIGSTKVDSGVPNTTKNLTKLFKYNHLKNLRDVIEENKKEGIACVVMEPASSEEPIEGYLQGVKDLCEQNNIILIFDEVVSGFRFHPKGAQYLYGVTPHLSSFGKSIANGFSFSALAGKRDIMELGGIKHDKQKVFLMSSTYGAETHHLRAAQKTIELLNNNNYEVTKHIWDTGKKIKNSFNEITRRLGIYNFIRLEGIDCRPNFVFFDKYNKPDMVLKTLFLQEMIKQGILLKIIAPSFSHRESEINQTIEAFEKVLNIIQYAIESKKVRKLLIGNPIKPVFRKYN